MADDRYILVRVPQLPELANVQAGAYVVGYNTATDQTVKINVSALGGGTETDINWRTNVTYATGQIVEYGLKLWKSLIDDNLGNFPNEGVNWTEVSKAGAGSNVSNYTPGVYTYDPTVVLRQSRMYYLLAAKPFESVDFITELEAGSWREVNRNNIIGVAYTERIGSDYYFPNLDDTLIVLTAGSIGIENGEETVFNLTITEPSYVIRTGTGYTAGDFTILPIFQEGQSNLVKILDSELAGNDMALQLPVNGAVLALHTSGSFRWVDSNNDLLATVIFTEYSLITRTGAGTTLADITIKPLKDLIFDLPQSRIQGLVAKLIELEQSNPVRYVEFFRSPTIDLFGETYYTTDPAQGTGPVLNISIPVSATTLGTADQIIQLASVPVLAGEEFTVRQVNINVIAYKNSTSRVVTLYFELWNLSSTGVLTQLGTSNALTLTDQPLMKDMFLALDPNYVTTVGDRAILVGRVYQTGTGGAATATLSIADETGSRWSFDTVAQAGEGHSVVTKDGTVLTNRAAIKLMDGLNARDNTGTGQTEFYTENTNALPNIESLANASQPTINGKINARLFEQIAFVLSGYDIDVTTDSQDILKALPYAFKAYEIRAEFATAPTGSSATVTFYKNGVSIGTITILAGEFSGTTVLSPIASFAKGDSLSAAVTQIGLTIPGATAKAYIQGIKYQ